MTQKGKSAHCTRAHYLISHQAGGDGHDKVRLRIWNDSTGLIYDNHLNAPDSADPATVLGGGSIVIHH